MLDLETVFAAAATGLVSGVVLSIPPGPVNLTILNEGARRGFRYAATVGLGAALMELIFCAIAFTGFAQFFTGGTVKNITEALSAAFIIFLGIKFSVAKISHGPGRVGEHIEKRFHPESAFMKGFVRVLGNPGLLGGWIILATGFLAQPTFPCKAACVLGIGLGTILYFCVLSYVVAASGKNLSNRTLLWMERGSGIGLLLFGIGYAVQIAWRLTHHTAS